MNPSLRQTGGDIQVATTLTSFDAAWPAWTMATPLSAADVVDLGEAPARAAERLSANSFDQAPVLDRHMRPVGWAAASDLRRSDSVAAALHALQHCVIVSEQASVGDVILSVVEARVVFLAGKTGITHFVVPSDLDRHPVRSHLFDQVARLEAELAALVRRALPDDMIVARLKERGSWRYRRAVERHLDAHPVEYLYLGDYADLVDDQPVLASALGSEHDHTGLLAGVSSGGQDRPVRASTHAALVDELVLLRNKVAHPSAALLSELDPSHVAALTRSVRVLRECAADALQGRSGGG